MAKNDKPSLRGFGETYKQGGILCGPCQGARKNSIPGREAAGPKTGLFRDD